MADETDNLPEYRYLDQGSYVVVPGPQALSGDRHVWLSAPVRRPALNPLRRVALAVMLVASASLVERADRYGEEQHDQTPLILIKQRGASDGTGDAT